METPMTFDPIADLAKIVTAIDQRQTILIENGQSIDAKLENLTGLVTGLIQILTAKPAQKGQSLSELLAQIMGQLKENNRIQTEAYKILLLLKEKAQQQASRREHC
jgi:hypothetical protein